MSLISLWGRIRAIQTKKIANNSIRHQILTNFVSRECTYKLYIPKERSEMTLDYRVIVERCPFPNEVVGDSNPVVKFNLLST